MAIDDPLSLLVDTSLLVTDGGLHVTIYHEPPQGTSGTAQAPRQDTQRASVTMPEPSGVAQGTSQAPRPSTSSKVDNFFSTYHVDQSLTLQYLQGRLNYGRMVFKIIILGGMLLAIQLEILF